LEPLVLEELPCTPLGSGACFGARGLGGGGALVVALVGPHAVDDTRLTDALKGEPTLLKNLPRCAFRLWSRGGARAGMNSVAVAGQVARCPALFPPGCRA